MLPANRTIKFELMSSHEKLRRNKDKAMISTGSTTIKFSNFPNFVSSKTVLTSAKRADNNATEAP